MQIIKDIEQGSPEWLNLRVGVVTASRFKDVLAKGAGKTRLSYMRELAAEIITGEPQESYSNQYMEWGNEQEPIARAMYELDTASIVEQVTIILNDECIAGYSPDGLVGENGIIEIKCPKTTTQIETYLSGKMPSIHKAQVQGGLWVSEREWCDFISFDPRINTDSKYFIERIYRDESYIKELAVEVDKFQTELKELVSKL